MIAFYWVMATLTVATVLPSALFMLLYAFTGEEGCLRRARTLWGWAKMLGLLGFNLGIWGHVAVGAWRLTA
ncbi:MAG: hypothetical protein V4792_07835 [Pseudomonadota bacterium]